MNARNPILHALKHAARLVEGTSPTHDRLQKRLDAYACGLGFTEPFAFSESRPDVLRTDGASLFVGDAKVAANEPPTKKASALRIASYVRTLQLHLLVRPLRSGTLCIATDDATSALEWRDFLMHCSAAFGLTPVASGLKALGARTWLAHVEVTQRR